MLFAAVMLSIGMFWEFAFNQSLPVIGSMMAGGVAEDLSRLPQFFWGWRWIALAAVLLSIPLAWLDRFAQRYHSPLRERIAGSGLLAAVTAVVTTIFLLNTDQSLYNAADTTGTLPTLIERQTSPWSLTFISIPVSLGLAGAAWFYWSWWHRHWCDWLHVRSAPALAEASEEWFQARDRRVRTLRLIAALLAVSVVLALGALQLYQQLQTSVQSGTLWPEPGTPTIDLGFQLAQPQRRLIVENTFGTGVVSVSVLNADGTQVIAPQQLTFEGARLGNQRITLPVEDLPAQRYVLRARLDSGDGGQVGYALVQGSGWLSTLAALLVGLALGIMLALAALLVSVFVTRVAGMS
jgi:hypothetical protein